MDAGGAVSHVGVSLTFGLVVFAMIAALAFVQGPASEDSAELGLEDDRAEQIGWGSGPFGRVRTLPSRTCSAPLARERLIT